MFILHLRYLLDVVLLSIAARVGWYLGDMICGRLFFPLVNKLINLWDKTIGRFYY